MSTSQRSGRAAITRSGRVLAADATRAVGRFRPGGPLGYRAQVPGARLRATRAGAIVDAIAWWDARDAQESAR